MPVMYQELLLFCFHKMITRFELIIFLILVHNLPWKELSNLTT